MRIDPVKDRKEPLLKNYGMKECKECMRKIKFGEKCQVCLERQISEHEGIKPLYPKLKDKNN